MVERAPTPPGGYRLKGMALDGSDEVRRGLAFILAFHVVISRGVSPLVPARTRHVIFISISPSLSLLPPALPLPPPPPIHK